MTLEMTQIVDELRLACGTASIAGIGIDFEPTRTVRHEAFRFFMTAGEQARIGPSDALRIWTVKEALFKADPGNHSALLIDFELADPTALAGWATGRCEGRHGRFRYASIALETGIVSCAVRIRSEER